MCFNGHVTQTKSGKVFADYPLNAKLLKALHDISYVTPTPIQEQAIPILMAGHDVLGIAQTGTGKTASFCLPILHELEQKNLGLIPKHTHVLILTPTRELAIQIYDNLVEYGKYLKQSYAVIFGGVNQTRQVKALKSGVDVLVATPGRLLDLIEQKHLSLQKLSVFVLDEADRMLDMGFIRDIKKIIPMLPKQRRNVFFSATMPKEINALAQKILVNPKKIEVTPESTTVESIEQRVMFVEKKEKVGLLLHLLKDKSFKKVLIFVGMKHMANKVVERLHKNKISAAAIHGNKSQAARQKAIKDFSSNKVRVLVATDIAARGIDIDDITHVINYDLPNEAESYVHRIGRTARAGKNGIAISLVTADEKSYLKNIENKTKQSIAVEQAQPFHSDLAQNAAVVKPGKAKAKIEAGNKARRPRRKKPFKSKNAAKNGSASKRPFNKKNKPKT